MEKKGSIFEVTKENLSQCSRSLGRTFK